MRLGFSACNFQHHSHLPCLSVKNCDGEQCLAAVAAWFKFALARNPKVLFWPRRTRTRRHASWFALPPERVMCEFPETSCHRQKHLWDFKHVNMMNICHCLVPYFHILPPMLPHGDPHGYRRKQPHFGIQLRGCCCGSEQTHPESGGKFQKGPAERFFFCWLQQVCLSSLKFHSEAWRSELSHATQNVVEKCEHMIRKATKTTKKTHIPEISWMSSDFLCNTHFLLEKCSRNSHFLLTPISAARSQEGQMTCQLDRWRIVWSSGLFREKIPTVIFPTRWLPRFLYRYFLRADLAICNWDVFFFFLVFFVVHLWEALMVK